MKIKKLTRFFVISHYHITHVLICIIVASFLSCFSDSSDDGSGVIEVTVKTSALVWNYPLYEDSIYKAYSGDTLGKWQYSEVGGDLDTPGYNDDIASGDVGDKVNIVYIYSALGDGAKDTPVLYKGVSSANDGVIRIKGIAPGTYYVVAFYDYCTGGNQENLLNRYDRYAIYTDTDPEGTTANSTPFMDNATTVTIGEDSTVSITLEIGRDWALGKPKVSDGGVGRLFLKTGDAIPSP